MVRGLIDFALNNRFLVTVAAFLLLIWGAISFHNLPVEAYPDVANNYVQVITQWPGHAAEEVEQQVTIPIEIVMNGIPHLEHLRSTSLFGLSSLMLIFDDESANDWNRQKVLERLSQLSLPAGLQPQIGSDYSPVGQIYWYTLKSTNPQLRPDGAEVARRLDARKAVQIGARRGGCRQLRRHHARVPGGARPEPACGLRPEHRPGRAATGQQQRQRGRKFRRSRFAADQRARRSDWCAAFRTSRIPSSRR